MINSLYSINTCTSIPVLVHVSTKAVMRPKGVAHVIYYTVIRKNFESNISIPTLLTLGTRRFEL